MRTEAVSMRQIGRRPRPAKEAAGRCGTVRGAVFLGVLLSLLGALQPPRAAAFVRSRTKSCRPTFWPQSCLYIQPDGDLLGPDMADAAVETAIENAIQSWNDHISVSSFMQLRYLPPRGPQEVNPLDGLQLIKFRRDRWCRPATATDSDPVCFDQSATAVTTVTFINRPTDPLTDGTIIDADIDFNAVNFHFYDADQGSVPTGSRSPVDLWNTVTHELGHVMGLEHPCSLFSGAIAACAVDDQGSPVPDCSAVEASRFMNAHLQTVYESTMYPTSVPGETTKRRPHADDVAGIITAYPKVSDPLTCRLPVVVQNAGCAAAPLRAPQQAVPIGAAVLVLALALRRRRAS